MSRFIKIILVSTLALSGFSLVGCTSSSSKTMEEQINDPATWDQVMSTMWDRQTEKDRTTICSGYNLSPDLVLDGMLGQLNIKEKAPKAEDMIRGRVKAFLDDHC